MSGPIARPAPGLFLTNSALRDCRDARRLGVCLKPAGEGGTMKRPGSLRVP